ncbi:MAG: ATP-binding protein, partial [Gammaproteobacteria bacterium]|nr:ATP-binding protein [Gammaproteobacteria bacterium]
GVAHHWLGYENTASSATATLQQTGVTDALTLADLSLYYTNRNNIPAHIVPLYSGDTVLRNNFHAIVVRQDKHVKANTKLAINFLNFLISKQGQDLISNYSERNFGTDLFQPAAHLDPNIQARLADEELKEQQQNLYLLTLLSILLFVLLVFTILLGLKLRKANLKQIENEWKNQQLVHDRDIALKSGKIKDEFISIVSHELRTPLTSIIAAQSLLENIYTKKSEQEHDLFEMATRNSERLLAVINDLLDMEKIHSDAFRLHKQAISLSSAIQTSIHSNTPLATSYSVTLGFEQGDSSCTVIADESRIIQVLTNLVSNAIKHAPAKSTVQIHCYRTADIVEVSVRDLGVGIPSEYTERIFDRFTQVDSSSCRKTGGTGLGLAISKTIIEQHGGKIGFRDNQPCGSIFYFTLPVER